MKRAGTQKKNASFYTYRYLLISCIWSCTSVHGCRRRTQMSHSLGIRHLRSKEELIFYCRTFCQQASQQSSHPASQQASKQTGQPASQEASQPTSKQAMNHGGRLDGRCGREGIKVLTVFLASELCRGFLQTGSYLRMISIPKICFFLENQCFNT